MKSTTDHPKKLDALIVNVIKGKTEFATGGVDFDSIADTVQEEWGDAGTPSKKHIFDVLGVLLRKLLVKRQEDGTYLATDLDAVAEELGISDYIIQL